MNLSAQEINKKTFDKINEQEILINHCNRAGLTSFPAFKEMYQPIYESYEPEEDVLIQAKKLIKNKKIKIVLGTWCSDSKINVSQFFKILDGLKFKEDDLEIIAVDGDKKTENELLTGLNIVSVPTFIVYDQKGKEMGRIIEHPKATLETDLLEILQTKKK